MHNKILMVVLLLLISVSASADVKVWGSESDMKVGQAGSSSSNVSGPRKPYISVNATPLDAKLSLDDFCTYSDYVNPQDPESLNIKGNYICNCETVWCNGFQATVYLMMDFYNGTVNQNEKSGLTISGFRTFTGEMNGRTVNLYTFGPIVDAGGDSKYWKGKGWLDLFPFAPNMINNNKYYFLQPANNSENDKDSFYYLMLNSKCPTQDYGWTESQADVGCNEFNTYNQLFALSEIDNGLFEQGGVIYPYMIYEGSKMLFGMSTTDIKKYGVTDNKHIQKYTTQLKYFSWDLGTSEKTYNRVGGQVQYPPADPNLAGASLQLEDIRGPYVDSLNSRLTEGPNLTNNLAVFMEGCFKSLVPYINGDNAISQRKKYCTEFFSKNTNEIKTTISEAFTESVAKTLTSGLCDVSGCQLVGELQSADGTKSYQIIKVTFDLGSDSRFTGLRVGKMGSTTSWLSNEANSYDLRVIFYESDNEKFADIYLPAYEIIQGETPDYIPYTFEFYYDEPIIVVSFDAKVTSKGLRQINDLDKTSERKTEFVDEIPSDLITDKITDNLE